MGVCCANANSSTPSAMPATMVDLSPPITMGCNKIEAFEKSLPFYRIEIHVLFAKIAEAEEKSGIEDAVTLKSLRSVLPTSAWAPLSDSGSLLSKLLLSDAFKATGTPAEAIDSQALRCFALLHCVGKSIDKASALYEILQGVGGLTKHEQISAGDKDFAPSFAKILRFASVDIFELANRLGEDVPQFYSDDEKDQMVSDENLDALREDDWLEKVYGYSSSLKNDAWLEKVQGDASWITEPEEIRAKILAQASLDNLHA